MCSAACQPSRRSRSTSPNLNARALRRAHLPLPDIDLVPARGRASDRRADTRAATLRRDASIFRADGSFPSGIGGCHVHLYQAFASSERLSARGALSFRRCLVADATHSIRDAFNDHASGVGSFPSSAFANHPGNSADHARAAASRSPDDAERRCARSHGHGAVAPGGRAPQPLLQHRRRHGRRRHRHPRPRQAPSANTAGEPSAASPFQPPPR